MATDNFNRADGGLGTNWTAQGGSGLSIASNQVVGAGSNSLAFYNAVTFADDQYSQVVAVTVDASHYVEVTVRAAGTGGVFDGYALFLGGASAGFPGLYRFDDGASTLLQSLNNVTSGDTIKVTVEGTTIKCWVNGSQTGTNQTDSTYTSGSAGIGLFTTGSVLDDWEGGDMAVSATGARLIGGRLVNHGLLQGRLVS